MPEWTDAQTPNIPDDAKAMFVHDYYFNYFQVGAESLGEAFFRGDKLAFGSAFRTAWEPLAHAALKGGVWLKGGYATESIRTGESIVSVASSASILYYSDVVTYPDNTSEDITIVSRPCPIFENGERMVMQRGAGFCTVRSTPEREQAAVTFLKWLTEPEHNVEFVTQTGYMPVTQTAFENEHLKMSCQRLSKVWKMKNMFLFIRHIWTRSKTMNFMYLHSWSLTLALKQCWKTM